MHLGTITTFKEAVPTKTSNNQESSQHVCSEQAHCGHAETVPYDLAVLSTSHAWGH